jgi:hypothetical protein
MHAQAPLCHPCMAYLAMGTRLPSFLWRRRTKLLISSLPRCCEHRQMRDNLGALALLPRLSPSVLLRVEAAAAIQGNVPDAVGLAQSLIGQR